LVALAYRELELAATGRLLPRPWEPATCRTPQLRQQLWCWLEAVVDWLTTENTWDVADTIPSCWPQLVHEIAVLADQRRRAGHAFTSMASGESCTLQIRLLPALRAELRPEDLPTLGDATSFLTRPRVSLQTTSIGWPALSVSSESS
jgi:hypothetical protein